jgi:methionyl aminopeptidase
MLAGIAQAVSGKRLGDIGYAVNKTAKEYGCKIIEELAGHGIGRSIHEQPIIFNIGKKGTGTSIVPGMVFTIEPILTLGSKKMRLHSDNWSIVVEDDKASAQFECTVAVFKNKTDILTLSSINLQKYIDFPPLFL